MALKIEWTLACKGRDQLDRNGDLSEFAVVGDDDDGRPPYIPALNVTVKGEGNEIQMLSGLEPN